jgi:heme exporter protein D
MDNIFAQIIFGAFAVLLWLVIMLSLVKLVISLWRSIFSKK